MRLWRLARRPYRAFDGEGARPAGGRWTSAGTPLVYTSAHLSLAALELLVHVDPDELPDDLVALEIEAPDDMSAESVARRSAITCTLAPAAKSWVRLRLGTTLS